MSKAGKEEDLVHSKHRPIKENPKLKSDLERHRQDYVRERLTNLTTYLRDHFTSKWVSVRKAFLDLDVDKDSVISPEDIMRYFSD